MGKTFTILNAGTAYDSDKEDVIADLAKRRMRGVEKVDWVFNPGPGSGQMVRQLARSPAGRTLDLLLNPMSPQLAVGPVEVAATIAGLGGGLGMEVNVESTVQLLRKRAPKPEWIVMAGWSRGSITCLMISNALNEDKDLADIPVRLFLIDPVPGGNKDLNGPTFHVNRRNWSNYATKVPKNVKKCAVILMEDENRGIMEPLVTPFYERTKKNGSQPTEFLVYPLPGPHRGAVEEVPSFEPSKVLGAHLCHSFLRDHGTDLKDPRILKTAAEVCNQYAALKLMMQEKGHSPSRRDGKVENLHRESKYFVNWHNKKEFETAFPRTAQMLDTGTQNAGADSEKTLMARYAPLVHRLVYGAQARPAVPLNVLQAIALREPRVRTTGRRF